MAHIWAEVRDVITSKLLSHVRPLSFQKHHTPSPDSMDTIIRYEYFATVQPNVTPHHCHTMLKSNSLQLFRPFQDRDNLYAGLRLLTCKLPKSNANNV